MELLRDKIWMIKVPEIIYNQILKERDLGYMDIYETVSNGEKKNEASVRLGGHIDPDRFDVAFNNTDNFFSFKDKKNKIRRIDTIGRFVATDETVSDRVTMNVTRTELTNKPSIAIEYAKGRTPAVGIIELSEHQFIATSDTYQKAMSQKHRKDKHLKKTRMDKEELKVEIFNLFSEKDFWTNKELVAKLDQPENYLKVVLTEMCNYIRSGPKKGCYELKPQYIRSKVPNEERGMDDEMFDDEL